MKKWGLFLAMLAIAAAFAFADEVAAVQVDDLFTDIEAVALSQGEMEAVDGGRGSKVLRDGGGSRAELSEMRSDAKLQEAMDKQARDRAKKDSQEVKNAIKVVGFTVIGGIGGGPKGAVLGFASGLLGNL